MLVIHPDECIDCGACEAECPTTAIFEENDVPPQSEAMVEFNVVMSGAAWDIPDNYKNVPDPTNIFEQKDPLPDADEAAQEEGKIQELVEKYGLQV
jgi:ferredoxin